jgi:hypothetical protein
MVVVASRVYRMIGWCTILYWRGRSITGARYHRHARPCM